MARKRTRVKINGNITGIKELAKLPVNCTITNAHKLDMTPEEFKKVQQRNAASIRKLGQIDPAIASKHTSE